MSDYFQSNTFKILRNAFQMAVAIAYLSIAYIFVLFMVVDKADLSDSLLTVIIIYLVGTAQIMNYKQKYKKRHKGFFFYTGVLAPGIAMTVIATAIIKIYVCT